MTKVLKFKPPGQAVAPKTSQYGDFSRRNFTFIYSDDIRDWFGKSQITKKKPNLF